MINIGILTATRAEYGLLKPIILKLIQNEKFNPSVLVTGAHLSSEFGDTYKRIEADGIPIAVKINILNEDDSSVGISKTMATAIAEFAVYFKETSLGALIVLGDRYETLAVCCAAMNARIPIIHLHGGEITEGAIDEAIRHSITKMSYLHFTSNEVHRKRVIQLGEDPSRVFNVGSIGVENALTLPLLSREEINSLLCINSDDKYIVSVFHPITLADMSIERQFIEYKNAIDYFSNYKFVIIKANADVGGRTLNKLMDDYSNQKENIIVFDSLSVKEYLSAVKYSEMVIGNSSSGIIEVPSFHIPTINIGDRQKGRLHAESVIDCPCLSEEIILSIEKGLDLDFRKKIMCALNPYGDGNTSEKIVSIIDDIFSNKKISLMKKFYDIDF